MRTITFHVVQRSFVLAFLLLFLTFTSFTQGTFQHFYGNGKGISVEKASTGYLLIVERATGYEAIATDNDGNQLSTVNLGALCDKIKRLPNGYGKLTKGNAITGSTFEYLDNSGTRIWIKDLGDFIGITHDFAQKPDGSFLFFASRSLGVPYGDNYFLNLDVNGSVSGLYFLVTAEYGSGGDPDTVFIPQDGLMTQKTDGSFIVALSGVQKIGSGGENPATRIVHTDDIGNTYFSQEMTFVANVPFEITKYVDLVPTADNNYITVLHRADLFTGHNWQYFIHEKPGTWSYSIGYGLNSIFSGGSAEYFSTVSITDGGAVASEWINSTEYDPNTGQTTSDTEILLKNDFNGNIVWHADFPNRAFDMIELTDHRLAFIGEEGGIAYLVVLNEDGTMDCATPSGFAKLGSHDGHDYYISDVGHNWSDAHSIAASNGGYLASIDDAAENTFLKNKISELVFIGLNDETTEGSLEWDSGDPFGYSNINTVCVPCGFNDATHDYGVMMPWDGSWGFDNQWVVRKFILEKTCNAVGEVVFAYQCPTTFPQDIMQIPVLIDNTTAVGLPAQTLYLHQDFDGGFPTTNTPVFHGQLDIPSIAAGDFFTGVLTTTSMGFMPELSFVDGTAHFHDSYGKYYFSFDPTGLAKSDEFDYYCKKFSSDLAIAITNPVLTYGSPDDIYYSVEITNNGLEEAHNIRAVLLEQNFGVGPPIFPNSVEVNVTGAGTVDAIQEGGGTDVKIECHIGTLAVGETVTCDVIYHIGFGAAVPNEYTVDVSLSSGHLETDSNMGNNSDSHTFYKDLGFGCPTIISDFTSLGQYGGHAYYMSNTMHTWHDAQLMVIANGGYLAAMNDLPENEFLKSKLGFNMVFIGLEDETTEGIPLWENGDPMTLDLSYNNSPSNDYAVMNFWEGTWEFYNIWVNKKFVMEMDCTFPVVQPPENVPSVLLAQIYDLFPNPATDQISLPVQMIESAQKDFQIFDALGRVYLDERRDLPKGNSIQVFDITKLSQGMYFFKIGQSSEYQRFVKM